MYFLEVIQAGVRKETGALVEKAMLSFIETMQRAMGEEDVAMVYIMNAMQGVVREEAGAVVEKAMLSFMEGPMGEADVVMVEKDSRGTSLTSS